MSLVSPPFDGLVTGRQRPVFSIVTYCSGPNTSEEEFTVKRIGKFVVSVLGFGLIAFALGFFNTRPTPAQAPPPPPSQRVTVTNIPLPVQGTVTANIANTPVP